MHSSMVVRPIEFDSKVCFFSFCCLFVFVISFLFACLLVCLFLKFMHSSMVVRPLEFDSKSEADSFRQA